MGIAAARVFKLSNFPGSLGLSCSEEGLQLAGVPLLNHSEQGFTSRPAQEVERLLVSVYGPGAFSEVAVKRLEAIAHALNAGETALAMTSAVLLKFPEPDWNGAARIAQADALLKYDPDEPRDWRGRWTARSGGASVKPKVQLLSSQLNNEIEHFLDAYEQRGNPFWQGQQAPKSDGVDNPFPLPADWVHLPDGNRNDEIGDLLESIANARLSDAPAIAKEIDRQFVQTGDLDDALKLWDALHDIATKNNPTTADRRAILDKYEYLTHIDPSEVGRTTIDAAAQLMQLGLVPGGGPPDEPSGPEDEPAARDPNQPSESWEKGWAARGSELEQKYGGPGELPSNYPTIDRFWNGIATSWKSVDLRAGTYQDPARLMSRLNSYVDKLDDFDGAMWGGRRILSREINGKSLNVVVPKGSMTSTQRSVFDAVRSHARQLGLEFNFIED